MIVTDEYRANYALIEWKPLPKREISTEPVDSVGRAPYVISDTMDPVAHPVTGRILDSKSAFRQITRERGLQEVGNDLQPTLKTPERVPRPGPDIKRAIEELRGR